MPPQISDDEASDDGNFPVKEEKSTTVKEETAKERVVAETQEDLRVESKEESEEGEEDDDSDRAPDEYVVESIAEHLVDEESGEILYKVKWEGYTKKADMTWEPEINLETAPEILESYLASVGGKDSIIEQWSQKKAAVGQGKKRSRTSTGTNEIAAKKGRKNGKTTSATTPPAGAKQSEFRPPTGSWEDEVVLIDACEGGEGAVVVFLTWKGGYKTQHPLAQVYKRCPQKMLKFYESHLVFKRNEESTD